MNDLFISGLPRSGSTLLNNLLSQNPEISNIQNDRYWGTDESLQTLLGKKNPKILVTYRPILEVLASFIKLADQYPETNFIDKSMIEEKFPALSYRPLNDARCDWLMRPHGAIDLSNSIFKNMAIHKNWFHLVTYDELSTNPDKVMSDIYFFLQIENYLHNFKNVPQHDNSSDGDIFGIPTLHTIRPAIEKSKTDHYEILSDYVIEKYSNAMDFFTKGWLQFLS